MVVRASRVEVTEAVGADRRDLAVVQVHDLAGVADERGDVGGDEHLLVADAEHDGAAVTGHHDDGPGWRASRTTMP